MKVVSRTAGPASANLQGRCYAADGRGEEGKDMAFIGADVNRWKETAGRDTSDVAACAIED